MRSRKAFYSVNHCNMSGFTIIELMIAMVVMAIGIMGFLFLQTQSVKGRTFAREMDRATTVARYQLEELRSLNYDNNLIADDDSDTTPTKYPSTGTSITVAGNAENYDEISIGNFKYYSRYEVTTDQSIDDQSTKTKYIKLYIAWLIKEQNSTTTALVAHSLGAPLIITVSAD